MANATQIKSRIASIQDTMKITRAMYMISSTKLLKARKKLTEVEPFFYTIQNQIARIIRHTPNFQHHYFENRDKDLLERPEDKVTGIIVMTGDKGLAGAYNHNVFKLTEEMIAGLRGPYRLFVVGETGRRYFEQKGYEITKSFLYTAQNPSMHRARAIVEDVVGLFMDNELDSVYMVYTKMVSSMVMEASISQLLPLTQSQFLNDIPAEAFYGTFQEDFVMYPSAAEIIDRIVPTYITGFTYGALVEAFSCEQNARMQAMQTATDSGAELLHELSIEYNRVRQTAITQEINEVIGGAKALKRKKERALKKKQAYLKMLLEEDKLRAELSKEAQ